MAWANRFRGWIIFFLVAGMVLPAKPAWASERMALTFIVASREGHEMDLDNDAYRDQLIQVFNYSSYRQTGRQAVNLEFNTPQTAVIPGDYELVMTLKNCEDNRCIVRAVIQKGGTAYVDTVISVLKPGMFFLGGPKAENGDLIIVLEMGF